MLQQEEKKQVIFSMFPVAQQVLHNNGRSQNYNFNPNKLSQMNQNIIKVFSEAKSKYLIVKIYKYDEIEEEQTTRIIQCISEIRESKDKALLMAVQNLVNIMELLRDQERGSHFVQIQDDIGDMDLAQFLSQQKEPLVKETVFTYMYQMTRALALCQLNRIYHRDVKPSNFITIQGIKDISFIKLIDFNISKVLKTKTGHTHNKGTHGYWTYERFQEQADFALLEEDRYKFEHDVYSLGITFLEMLCAGTDLAKPLRTLIPQEARTELVMTKKTENLMTILDKLKKNRGQAWEDVIFITRKLLTPKAENRGDFFSLLGFFKKVVGQRLNGLQEYEHYYKRELKLCQKRRKSHREMIRSAEIEGYLTIMTKLDKLIDSKLSIIEQQEVPEFQVQPNFNTEIPYFNLRDQKLYIFNYQNETTQEFRIEHRDIPVDPTILYNKEGYLGIYGGGQRVESFRPSDVHLRLNFKGEIQSERRLPDNGHSQTTGVFVNTSTVFLIGGLNGDGTIDKNCIWFHYRESRDWTRAPALKYPRLHAGAVSVGQSIYVIGGVWSQGAQSLDIEEIFYHQKIVECFNRSSAFPKWVDFTLNIPEAVFNVQSPFMIPYDKESFIFFGGRRYKYLKDEGVYVCNVRNNSVKVFVDWFHELRITPTNPVYTNKRRDEFYFGHQFLGRERPQFYKMKLSKMPNEEGRVELHEFQGQ